MASQKYCKIIFSLWKHRHSVEGRELLCTRKYYMRQLLCFKGEKWQSFYLDHALRFGCYDLIVGALCVLIVLFCPVNTVLIYLLHVSNPAPGHRNSRII